MNKILSLLVASVFAITPFESNAQFGKLLDKAKSVASGESGLSQNEIGAGLKEALEVGVGDAVKTLSAENGYLESAYKIEIPAEAQSVAKKVKNIPGFQNIEEDLVKKMNEAAEIAAKKATPIFLAAIKEITFTDAKNILTGDDNAATDYLSDKSRKKLYAEFMPIIQAALDQVNARALWESATTAYNKIPFTKEVNTQLDDHVNQSALDGLFALIAVKEAGIRGDSSLRTSDLLKKVFGSK